MEGARRDWRWWTSRVGRVLVATGLLLLGFVAYQLWGTGIQTARAQSQLADEFDDFLAQAAPVPTSEAPATTVAPTTSSLVLPPSETLPVPGITSDPNATTIPSGTLPPVTLPPPVVDGGLVPSGSGPSTGDPVFRLEIPRIGLNKVVVSGVDTSSLRKGPGHYPEMAMPGEIGNAGVAGHRTTYGAPFEKLDKLKPGDQIIATTPAGRFVYVVDGTQIVQPDDAFVLADTPNATLTLTTCHPRFSTAQRLVVTATIDEGASDPLLARGLTAGWFGEGGGAPVPSTAPATPAAPDTTAPAAAASTAPGETAVADPSTVAPASTAASATTESSATSAPIAPDRTGSEVADAFSRGWFSDPSAWPQVAFWGGLLTLVGLGAWGLSRFTKRNWVGGLAGLLPFVVVLYFFYENAARLLPPNL